jgi:hypothetical protein
MDSLLSPSIMFTRRALLAGAALAALAPVGCLGKHFAKKDPPAPQQAAEEAAEPVAESQERLVCVWDSGIRFGEDQKHGGAPMPGLRGRAFLFGPDLNRPFVGDGSLIIDLYDCTPHRGSDAEPKLLEELRIDPKTLKNKLAQKDFVGDGYTILFPWYTYRPDISHVNIIMRYTFADGRYLMHQSGLLAINHTDAQERIRRGMPISNPSMRAAPGAPNLAAPNPPTTPNQLPHPSPVDPGR